MLGAGLLYMAWRQEAGLNIVRTGVCCSRRGLEVYYRLSSYAMSRFSFVLLLSLCSAEAGKEHEICR